jgi:protoporphyrinogen/coproporphyrinogen III oxidase
MADDARGPLRVAIVGGGVTGLAAAHEALIHAQNLGRGVTVTVLEKAPRLGGNLITERSGGFVLDAGADSWVAAKPHAAALAREVGLEASIIGTREGTRRYFVAWQDRLHPVPDGLVLGVPTRVASLVRTPIFSPLGKLRMALEPFIVARRFEGDDDESIADFAVRRLGREAADRLVAPLLGGISAGDASDLSIRAAFPQFVAMEREHGSLVRGTLALQRARGRAPGRGAGEGAFRSLEGGIAGLVDAVAEHVRRAGALLRTGVGVRTLSRAGAAWSLDLDGGERIPADAVILAVPARAASTLLRGTDDGVARDLDAVPFGSTATVFLGYRREDVAHPLDGVGFVVPRSLGRPILAGTWVSSKWEGRAPDGHVLVRAFFSLDDAARDDDSLVQLARSELRALMGLSATPVLSRAFRFEHASPQMRVGHLARMRRVRERLALVAPGVRVAGGGYEGIGIPDSIKQGREAAQAIVSGR